MMRKPDGMTLHLRTNHKEAKAHKQYAQVNKFRLNILFMEGNHAIDETYNHASPSDHRHYGHHRPIKRERIKISYVCNSEKQCYAWDCPSPLKFVATFRTTRSQN